MKKDFHQAVLKIITTGHRVTDEVGRALKEYDCSEPQYNVLRILKGANEDPINVQDINCKMIQKSSNVTRIIDKLLSKDFVIRRECPSNRRKMDILITDKGLEFVEILTKKIEKIYKNNYDNITQKESEQLIRIIDKMFSDENNK